MIIAQLLLSLLIAFLLHQLYNLYINYQNARKTGLKIIIAPVYYYGAFWQLTQPVFTPLLRHLPEFLNAWYRTVDTSWTVEDGGRMIRKYGEAFMVVSPSYNILMTADPEAIHTVLVKRKDFIKPKVYGMMVP